MRDFKDCVPADAHAYYTELFKHRTDAERKKHDAAQQKLLREAGARGHARSGAMVKAQWDLRAEYLDALAIGLVEDVLTIYQERELVLTSAICTCLADTAREHLNMVYQKQLQLSADGILGFNLLNSSVQEMSTRKFAAMPKINIMIERARLASAKREKDGSKEPSTTISNHITNNYMQNISGSHNTATMTGDVAQQQQFNLNQLAAELESLRTTLTEQTNLIDAADLKVLEDAENAAKEKDQTKLQRCFQMLSDGFWDATKDLTKQGLIELAKYLAAHGHHLLK